MDVYEAAKDNGKRGKSKALHKTGNTVRSGAPDREVEEQLYVEIFKYDEEWREHKPLRNEEEEELFGETEFGLKHGALPIHVSARDHWKLPPLIRKKAEETMELYQAGELQDDQPMVLLVEIPAITHGTNKPGVHVETNTAFLRTPGDALAEAALQDDDDDESFKVVKGRKGEVVVPTKKSRKSMKITECQHLQSTRTGYEFKGILHVYYLFTANPTNKQSLQLKCRCDYCMPDLMRGGRGNKRLWLVDNGYKIVDLSTL